MSKSIFVASLLFCAACGPTATTDNFGNGDANGGGGGGGGGSGSGSSCASSMVTAQQSPLDIYMMLDQSGSMTDTVSGGGTKWSAVTSALDAFLTQPGLTGFSVGLQYFGLQGGGFGDSCTASDYATAAVEIAPLPGSATALTSSIAAHSPTTGTPTSAALQGAINHATTWATAHTGDVTAVVFATDGDPSECDTNLANINAIAAAGWAATPKIATFVIGVGSSLSALNGIAAAGGTTSAFLVDTSSNVNQQFLDAMNAIRNSASCTYQIPLPTSGTVDYTQVNVVFTPNGGQQITIPNVANKMACPASGDGWYYDNPASPTAIILCETTCGSVQASGVVQITLGCDTVIL
jgi:hypothetical protein